MDKIAELREYHAKVGPKIKARLKEFEKIKDCNGDDIFKELCFCVLTANTSAEMGLKAMDAAGGEMVGGNEAKICEALKSCGYRYPNKRAEYIVYNKEKIKEGLKEKVDSCTDAQELRDYLVKNVKGLGCKEASHFLRNIGFRGFAILDKHILSSLAELGVIGENRPPKNKKEYLEIEKKMKRFAGEIGLDMDELDLLLWSRKTGKILK
jgi:N-glycosylase/DNA lyase